MSCNYDKHSTIGFTKKKRKTEFVNKFPRGRGEIPPALSISSLSNIYMLFASLLIVQVAFYRKGWEKEGWEQTSSLITSLILKRSVFCDTTKKGCEKTYIQIYTAQWRVMACQDLQVFILSLAPAIPSSIRKNIHGEENAFNFFHQPWSLLFIHIVIKVSATHTKT